VTGEGERILQYISDVPVWVYPILLAIASHFITNDVMYKLGGRVAGGINLWLLDLVKTGALGTFWRYIFGTLAYFCKGVADRVFYNSGKGESK